MHCMWAIIKSWTPELQTKTVIASEWNIWNAKSKINFEDNNLRLIGSVRINI